MEILLADALPMIAIGAIQDGKTIMLLQHAAIVGLDRLRDTEPENAWPKATFASISAYRGLPMKMHFMMMAN